MINLFKEIRRPVHAPTYRKYLFSTLLFVAGVMLGAFSKLLDETPSNLFPFFLDVLDLG